MTVKNKDARSMRLSKEDLDDLQLVKQWYLDDVEDHGLFDVEEISNAEALNYLFCYYRNNSPKRLEEKQDKLLRKYVTEEQFNKIWEDRAEILTKSEKKAEELEGAIQNIKKINEFTIMLLSSDLACAEEEIEKVKIERFNLLNDVSSLTEENKKLKIKVDSAELEIPKLKDKLYRARSTYSSLNAKLDIECLETLFYITRLLAKHKRKWFSQTEIEMGLGTQIGPNEVEDALRLVGYKVLPVKKAKGGDVMYYRFKRW